MPHLDGADRVLAQCPACRSSQPDACAVLGHTYPIQQVYVTRAELRRIVDAAWNEATESQTVPSTDWADRIIDGVLNDKT